MIRTVSNNKNGFLALTVTLILLVTITSVLASFFIKPDSRTNTDAIINQPPKQSPLPATDTGKNETNSSNATNSLYHASSKPSTTNSPSFATSTSTTYTPPSRNSFFSLLPNNLYAPVSADPISLDNSKFDTYTYGGYSVQQPDSTQFIFSFPDNTRQGELAGSDALSLDTFAIQKIEFDAVFIAPKINALGFDEMVIFASSDTNNYKGTEFGVRMDLKDGFVYGYVQEPNGVYGDVDFQMLSLTPNDGLMHHYTLIVLGAQVSFYIDGVDFGYLNFSSNTDYSNLTFSILAVVHRFTDDWDSNGNNMTAGNFLLNQQ
jgi:hypothetical protein